MPSIKPTDQATFQQLLANDPQIQAIVKSVWGDTPVNQRPSDTPKELEKANGNASRQIAALLESRGVKLPDRTFINPRTMSLEGARGWAGLPTAAKIAIIGGLAATGIGAAGAMGAFGGAAAVPSVGVTSGLPAGLGGAGIAGTTGAGLASGAGVAGTAGSAIGGLMSGGAAGSTAGATAGTTAAKSVGGKLMGSLLKPGVMSTVGRGLGSIAETQANNRGTALDAMMEGDRIRLDANRDRRADETDLWRKIQAANYMKSGGSDRTPVKSSSGATLPSFGFGPKPISAEDKQMADTLLPQLQQRLANPLQLSDYASKMNPGKTESILGWLAPILGTYDVVRNGNGQAGQTNGQPPVQPPPTAGTPVPPPNPFLPKPTPPHNPIF